MAVSNEYRTFIQDQLEGFGPVTVRAMFGGAGVFRDGIMFGLIADETLYFKIDDTTKGDFEAEGSEPFVYTKAGKATAMSYWRVPETALRRRRRDDGMGAQLICRCLQGRPIQKEEEPQKRLLR